MLFCFGYALPAVVMATDPFMFFSGGFICAVGIASNFREYFTSTVHQYSALLAIVFSQISILFYYQNYWLVGIMVVSAIILYLLRNKFSQWMLILEWVAFITVAITLK